VFITPASQRWNVVGEYVDHGVSGTKESRPALNRLMADAKQRRFDVIAVWKIDRFGRSLRHLVNSLAELESLGVGTGIVALVLSFSLLRPAGTISAILIRRHWPEAWFSGLIVWYFEFFAAALSIAIALVVGRSSFRGRRRSE
jgi:hypothetical protein